MTGGRDSQCNDSSVSGACCLSRMHNLVTSPHCPCLPAGSGHEMEIVCLNFNPQSTLLATGSMDHTAKVGMHDKHNSPVGNR